jgi:hypothetical protein
LIHLDHTEQLIYLPFGFGMLRMILVAEGTIPIATIILFGSIIGTIF